VAHGAPVRRARTAQRAVFCVLGALLALTACSKSPELEIAAGPDEPLATVAACAPSSRAGPPGASARLRSPEGVSYRVRAPLNYSPLHAHPLLVVYAPAQHSPAANEAFTQLTHAATARGWLVAYAGALPMSLAATKAFAQLPADIARHYCVDDKKIFATGHSDGGTLTTALAVLPGLPHPFRAIAPSAAGMTGEDLKAYPCPAPLPVRVFHNTDDTHFPGYGAAAARWWAQCNGCRATRVPEAAGCWRFEGCPAAAGVTYCERPGGHQHWPTSATELLSFFSPPSP